VSKPALRVLFESDDPKRYMIGQDGSDLVWLFDPASDRRPSRPVPPASIAAHMPYTNWKEFEGNDAPILERFRTVEGGSAGGDTVRPPA